MERSSARSACRVVTLRSADCQAEDKAGKIITSWQTSVIRKERPWLRWLSTPPPAMLLGGAPWRFPQSSPHLSYPFTRRHLGEDKKWTACSDLSSPCSRKHSTAHSSGEGPVSSWDNPSKPVLCSGLLCCFRNGSGQLLVLPPLPSPIIAAREQTSKSLAKAFQLWPTATVHFHWQIICYFLGEVVTTFSLDSDNFLSSLLFLPTFHPRDWFVLSASVSLPSHCCIQGEGIVFALFHYYLLLVCFQ